MRNATWFGQVYCPAKKSAVTQKKKKKNELAATASDSYVNYTHIWCRKNPEITLNKLKTKLLYIGNAVSNKKISATK
jgi:hypothetical protein